MGALGTLCVGFAVVRQLPTLQGLSLGCARCCAPKQRARVGVGECACCLTSLPQGASVHHLRVRETHGLLVVQPMEACGAFINTQSLPAVLPAQCHNAIQPRCSSQLVSDLQRIPVVSTVGVHPRQEP